MGGFTQKWNIFIIINIWKRALSPLFMYLKIRVKFNYKWLFEKLLNFFIMTGCDCDIGFRISGRIKS